MAQEHEGQRSAGDAAPSAARNPYVRRLIEDEELRDNHPEAYEAARDAYARMANGKGPAKALMDDKKVHQELRDAAESLREASDRLRGKRKKALTLRQAAPARRSSARSLALAPQRGPAQGVLDRLFGAEEEFEYTSATSAPANGRRRTPKPGRSPASGGGLPLARSVRVRLHSSAGME